MTRQALRHPRRAAGTAAGCASLVVAALSLPAPADELTAETLDAVVVTADRIATPLSASPTAVQVIEGDVLRSLPAGDLAEALASMPGMSFVSLGGSSGRPVPITRGFYGGGENGYLQILVDGIPINRSESGVVVWDAVPLEAIERVEVVRGASSAQYGDAAVGGVINIITRDGDWSLIGAEVGSFGQRSARLSLGDRDSFLSRQYAAYEETDGFRDHSARRALTTGSVSELAEWSGGRAYLRTSSYSAEAKLPGALPADVAVIDPAASDVFYRFDAEDEDRYSGTLDVAWQPAPGQTIQTLVTATYRDAETVRTLPLAPYFADTQRNDLTSREIELVTQWTRDAGGRFKGNWLLGAEVGRTWLDSDYALLLRGPASVYDGTGAAPALTPLVEGEVTRSALALFAQRDWWLTPDVRLLVGVRGDRLVDNSSIDGSPDGADDALSAWSGRTGLSWQYLDTAHAAGSAYAAVSREFRAPTLVQLFDPRPIPTPFGDITLSNPGLEPQVGTGFEVGLNHRMPFGGPGEEGSIAVSLAAYRIELRNEIDLDLAIFRYGNIGRSLHTGVEAGVEARWGASTVFTNYTRQDVENAETGLQVKAIPLDTANIGWRYGRARGLTASAVARYVGGAYLDDANTERLDNVTVVDARVGYRFDDVLLFLEAANLFDERYASTGYTFDYQTLEGGFARQTYLYPAAGRSFRFGLQWFF
ncbi:TonB-dependent receptor [Lysobacter korlensis]|uniref:TonB-dependent receptor n=1 Tax=Lysobacter korlensis TaxID=553636 RepID=A0ABV6S014_9GAMM